MPPRKGYSRETRLKVQRLYLGKGLGSQEIAAELGIPVQQVYNVVHRYGLAEIRAKNERKALAHAADRAVADAEEFVASITPQAMEEAEGGFELSRRARAEGDAKAFAMAAKGVQVFVQVARQGLGLDASGSAGAGRGSSISIIFGQPFSDAREAAVEVSASPVADAAAEEAVELDFAESQQAAAPAAESAELIGNAAQVVGICPVNTGGLNKARHSQSYVN